MQFSRKTERPSCPVGIPQLSLNFDTSMCATRTSRDSTISEPFYSKTQTSGFFTQRQDGYQSKERFINPMNEIVPGVKFGRYFGTLEEATERQVKRRISERTGQIPTQLEVATETVRGLSKGRQFTTSEKILINKIDQIEKEIKRYADLNEKMKKQNEQLREHNKSLRILSDVKKKKMDSGKENNHIVLKTKMVSVFNPSKIGGNQIRVSRIQ